MVDSGLQDIIELKLRQWETDEEEKFQYFQKTRSLSRGVEAPLYAYILKIFDEGVEAAKTIQRAFRQLKSRCSDGVLPSDQDPFHHKHFGKIRELVGWSRDELYNEYGDLRQRTDGGRAPRRVRQKSFTRVLDAIHHTKDKPLPAEGHEELVKQLDAARGAWTSSVSANAAMSRILNAKSNNVSMVSNYLRERWKKLKQDKLKDTLANKPLQDEFNQGSTRWEKLMTWMMSNGHSQPIRMRDPILIDLQSSLSVNTESHRNKIMDLLAQFNTILRLKQVLPTPAASQTRPKVSVAAVDLYDRVIEHTGLEFKETLEESNRYAITPPAPPDGLEVELYRFHAQVCATLAASKVRVCRLRKAGRSWVQAFEDSTQRRRRLIRTRSAGNLGLLGSPAVDAAATKLIWPLAGDPGKQGTKQWAHAQLQKIVDAQRRRHLLGRDLRPLHCINTEWLGGIDWGMIEAKATGRPLPHGPRIPPKLSDEELGDLLDVFALGSNHKEEPGEHEENADKGTEGGEEEVDASKSEASPKMPKVQPIPFDSSSLYVEEVHDMLQEAGLTDLDCESVLGKLMALARASKLLPTFDTKAAAARVQEVLAAGQGMGMLAPPSCMLQHLHVTQNDPAIMGSAAHDEALNKVLKEMGTRVLTRSISTLLPNELGRAIETAQEQVELPRHKGFHGAHNLTSRLEISFPMLIRAWRTGGMPGWQGNDGRTLWALLSSDNDRPPWDIPSPSAQPPAINPRPNSAPRSPPPAPALSAGSLTKQTSITDSPFTPGSGSCGVVKVRLKPGNRSSASGVMSYAPSIRDPYSPSMSCNTPTTLISPFAASSTSKLPSSPSTYGLGGSPSGIAHARGIVKERRRQQQLEAFAVNKAKRESWASGSLYSEASLKMPLPALKPVSSSSRSMSLKPSTSVHSVIQPKWGANSNRGSRPLNSQGTATYASDTKTSEDAQCSSEEEGGNREESEMGPVGPPRSDMLLLRRAEFWATVLADARVILLFAHNHMPWRPYWHGAGSKHKHLRAKAHAEAVQRLVAYVEHHMQLIHVSNSIRVKPAEIVEAAAEVRKHMQLSWCRLVKSEMYRWLNRYLVLGRLPNLSNFEAQAEVHAPQDAGSPGGCTEPANQEAQQEEPLSPFERKLKAVQLAERNSPSKAGASALDPAYPSQQGSAGPALGNSSADTPPVVAAPPSQPRPPARQRTGFSVSPRVQALTTSRPYPKRVSSSLSIKDVTPCTPLTPTIFSPSMELESSSLPSGRSGLSGRGALPSLLDIPDSPSSTMSKGNSSIKAPVAVSIPDGGRTCGKGPGMQLANALPPPNSLPLSQSALLVGAISPAPLSATSAARRSLDSTAAPASAAPSSSSTAALSPPGIFQRSPDISPQAHNESEPRASVAAATWPVSREPSFRKSEATAAAQEMEQLPIIPSPCPSLMGDHSSTEHSPELLSPETFLSHAQRGLPSPTHSFDTGLFQGMRKTFARSFSLQKEAGSMSNTPELGRSSGAVKRGMASFLVFGEPFRGPTPSTSTVIQSRPPAPPKSKPSLSPNLPGLKWFETAEMRTSAAALQPHRALNPSRQPQVEGSCQSEPLLGRHPPWTPTAATHTPPLAKDQSVPSPHPIFRSPLPTLKPSLLRSREGLYSRHNSKEGLLRSHSSCHREGLQEKCDSFSSDSPLSGAGVGSSCVVGFGLKGTRVSED